MIMQNNLISNLETKFVFKLRPQPVPGDLRPLWRIGLILLILRISSRANKSTLGRLHVLNWAIRSKQNQEQLLSLVSGTISPDALFIRIEPSLNRALDLAQGEGLVIRISGRSIKLTKKGSEVADVLIESNEILVEEKIFLEKLGKRVTEQIINAIFSWKS